MKDYYLEIVLYYIESLKVFQINIIELNEESVVFPDQALHSALSVHFQ